MGSVNMFTYDGHLYHEQDGDIFQDGDGSYCGCIALSPCGEYWYSEDGGGEFLGQIHVNERDARRTAILTVVVGDY